jgi:hypothetical protein
VYFYAEVHSGVSQLTLMNADTNQPIGVMLDDGLYSISGDDLPEDGIYTYRGVVDNSTDGILSFYAFCNTNEVSSNIVTVRIYSSSSQIDLAEKEAVNNAITSLLGSAEYKAMPFDRKVEAVGYLLNELANNGIDEFPYSLVNSMELSGSIFNREYSFRYTDGTSGGVTIRPCRCMMCEECRPRSNNPDTNTEPPVIPPCNLGDCICNACVTPPTFEKCALCSSYDFSPVYAPAGSVNVCDGLIFNVQPLKSTVQKTKSLWANDLQITVSVEDFGDNSEVRAYFYQDHNGTDVSVRVATLTPNNRTATINHLLWGTLYKVGVTNNGEQPIRLRISCVPTSTTPPVKTCEYCGSNSSRICGHCSDCTECECTRYECMLTLCADFECSQCGKCISCICVCATPPITTEPPVTTTTEPPATTEPPTTTTPEATTAPPNRYTCKLCEKLPNPGVKGHVLGGEGIEIFDALEILKHIVGIDNKIDNCDNALQAALITDGETPTIFDALEILKHLIGMDSKVK